MHGPEEVQFTCDLFSAIENALDIKSLTVKVGIMDEERRTTVNLKECIRAAKERTVFINTGFLDRTGDEIHTSMEAGPMISKVDMKQHQWIASYENWNVDIGLETGFKGNAQIGKGMWPMPDEMLGMYNTKEASLSIGNTEYYVVETNNLIGTQNPQSQNTRNWKSVKAELSVKITPNISSIKNELDNNWEVLTEAVRWIDQGVGCSKVPDINNVGLMEDRATCRISSQHIANWLHHNLCSEEQVMASMKKMAVVVDGQNSGDPEYVNMAPGYDGIAFSAACDLAIKGRSQPSGYTEPLLHAKRLLYKS